MRMISRPRWPDVESQVKVVEKFWRELAANFESEKTKHESWEMFTCGLRNVDKEAWISLPLELMSTFRGLISKTGMVNETTANQRSKALEILCLLFLSLHCNTLALNFFDFEQLSLSLNKSKSLPHFPFGDAAHYCAPPGDIRGGIGHCSTSRMQKWTCQVWLRVRSDRSSTQNSSECKAKVTSLITWQNRISPVCWDHMAPEDSGSSVVFIGAICLVISVGYNGKYITNTHSISKWMDMKNLDTNPFDNPPQ